MWFLVWFCCVEMVIWNRTELLLTAIFIMTFKFVFCKGFPVLAYEMIKDLN